MILSSKAQIVLFSLVLFAGLISAASTAPGPPSTAPTSFCKCTCFTNSTIIPLDAPSSANRPYTDNGGSGSSSSLLFLSRRKPDDSNDNDNAQEPIESQQPSHDDGEEQDGDKKDGSADGRKEYRAGNCNDCNRQFCLDYNLPICKKASMEDVFTTCFQRDSRKDEAVVFIFIAATVGLLGWAAVRPWVAKWYEKARERRNYIPVAATDS